MTGVFKATLEKLAAIPNVRGIRQILNCEPDWPRNGALGNLLANEAWLAGYKELAAVNFSFDAQLNPPQYKEVGLLARRVPSHPIRHATVTPAPPPPPPRAVSWFFYNGLSYKLVFQKQASFSVCNIVNY